MYANFKDDKNYLKNLDSFTIGIIEEKINGNERRVLENIRAVVNSMIKRDENYLKKIAMLVIKKDNDLKEELPSFLMRRKGFSAEKLKEYMIIKKKGLCGSLFPSLLRYIPLSEKELEKCTNKILSFRSISSIFRNKNIQVNEAFLEKAFKKKKVNLSEIPNRIYKDPQLKTFFFKHYSDIKKDVLNLHRDLRQRLLRGGMFREISQLKCSLYMNELLLEDEEVLVSLANVFPLCLKPMSSKTSSNKSLRNKILNGWSEFRKSVESEKIKDQNHDYYYLITRYGLRMGHHHMNQRIRGSKHHSNMIMSPLESADISVFENSSFIKKVLEKFPEEYYNLPPQKISEYRDYKEKANMSYYAKSLKRLR